MESNIMEGKRKTGLLRAFLLVLTGLVINLLFSNIVKLLELPLYIDTVGIIFTSAMGGYIPGVAVGYITNIINGISDLESYYYGTLSVFIAVIAAYGSRRGWFRKITGIIKSIILFTIAGGVLGSILTWMLYGFDPDSAKPIAASFYDNGNGLSPFWAQFWSDVIYDLIDKTITVIIVLGILIVVRKLLKIRKVDFSFWHQNVLSEENLKHVKKSKTRSTPLRTKILIILGTVMVIIACATTLIGFMIFHYKLIDDNEAMGTGITNITASLLAREEKYITPESIIVESDRIDEIIAKGEDDPEFKAIQDQMERIAKSHPDIQNIYVVRMTEKGYECIIDANINDDYWHPGQIIPYEEQPDFIQYKEAALNGEDIPAIIMDDKYGWFLTKFRAVRNSAGETVCYSCVDILMSHIQEDENTFLAKIISLCIGFFILIMVIVLWLTDYCVVYPLNALALSAKDMAFHIEGTEKDEAAKIKSLGITTGDEIETLYDALVKTSDDIVKHVNDIEEQKDTISEMQTALITVLANMVESRDKFTGNHVKNTASYAKIILDRLREDENYKDIITEDYEKTIINSAPLHDVGKIQIPDSLLNKNGRLTDEEFLKMQHHTLAGQKIIDEAASMVKDSLYLSEARNLAAYHHEKWNGTGYPYGLKGEDIPLSARIMAVADVFDALVSKRSYKPGFPVEKALDIIKEGAGTHFDPEIAKIFLDAEDEVRKVAEINYKRDNPEEKKGDLNV
ncbi:MAG: HD domain-containing protein [Lachnospiraceae bacterium]|nr:HD domain-containing protein [Lachnospiraceae bacterium]